MPPYLNSFPKLGKEATKKRSPKIRGAVTKWLRGEYLNSYYFASAKNVSISLLYATLLLSSSKYFVPGT